MTETYAPGTPLWIDLGTPDLAASLAFYSGLFGWQGEDMGEQMGHYTMMSQDGKPVAAIEHPATPRALVHKSVRGARIGQPVEGWQG